MELLEWQRPLAEHVVRELRNGPAVAIGACTGAGKTYICCDAIRQLGLPALVIAPKVSITQWRKVVEGMGVGELVVDVINPEQVSKKSGCTYYTREDGWKNVPYPCLLVVDEIHRGCSSHDSVTTNAVVRFGAKKVRPLNKLIAISATLADSPSKLAVVGYWMGFHRFVKASWFDWLRAHGYAMRRVGRNKEAFVFTSNPAEARSIMAKVRQDMGTRYLSVTPDEIPGFPDEVREVCLVDLARKDHDALVRAYEDMPERITQMSKDDMVKVLRLRQQAEWCKSAVLAEMAADLVEDGYSVFVAINFVDARTRVEEELAKRNIRFASIYGGQNEAERQAGVDAFQNNEIFCMVGMMQACSVALSLHDEKHERPRVSLISPSYAASDLVQALGRIRRVGGTTAVQKIVLVANSVEEKVAKSVQRKIDCIETLCDRDLER